MVPDVEQQLRAIRQTLAKSVVPAIPTGDSFAQEQAGLILASLNWILDVEAEESHYLRVEVADQQSLWGELAALLGAEADAGSVGAEADLADATVAELRRACSDLKHRTTAAFERLTADDDPSAGEARRLFDVYGRRQLAREAAWCRMTGFPKGPPAAIGEVLRDQQAESPVS